MEPCLFGSQEGNPAGLEELCGVANSLAFSVLLSRLVMVFLSLLWDLS